MHSIPPGRLCIRCLSVRWNCCIAGYCCIRRRGVRPHVLRKVRSTTYVPPRSPHFICISVSVLGHTRRVGVGHCCYKALNRIALSLGFLRIGVYPGCVRHFATCIVSSQYRTHSFHHQLCWRCGHNPVSWQCNGPECLGFGYCSRCYFLQHAYGPTIICVFGSLAGHCYYLLFAFTESRRCTRGVGHTLCGAWAPFPPFSCTAGYNH